MTTRNELVALLRAAQEWVPGKHSPADDLRRRIDAALAEPEPGKTVRVSLRVNVSPTGSWWIGSREGTNGVERFIIADVPIPQAVEVEGEVTP